MTQQTASHPAEASEVEPTIAEHAPARQWPRALRLALRGLLLLLLLFVGYKLVRVGWYGYQGYQHAQHLLALRGQGGIAGLDWVQAQTSVVGLVDAVDGIDQEMRFTYPALQAAKGLPWIGPTLAAIPPLATTGRAALDLGHDALAILAAEAAAEPGRDAISLALAALRNRPDDFVALATHATTMQTALAAIDAAALLDPLAAPVRQGQAALALVPTGLELTPALPTVLGFDAPQTYLLLVQNNQELRATGGFISAVGTVTLVNGRPQDLEFTDSYTIMRHDVDHPAAPEPQRRYMDIELVFLRDANWSPDFPTSAQLVRSLYAQDAGKLVSGVISIDLNAVALLIGALGPIEVADGEEPITGDNLVQRLQEFWDQPPGSEETIDTAFSEWWQRRKDFMPLIAKAAMARIEQGDFDPLALVEAAQQALDTRAVQVWMADAQVAQHLAAQRWDGGLHPQPGADYLALVDTNMGYNKVDAVLTRSLAYSVQWPDGPDAPAVATLSVTYRHPLQVDDVVCEVKSDYGLTYTDMMERCYFNYVRLFVPARSELIALTGVEEDSVTSRPGERGTQVLAGYFVVPPGQEHTVVFTYRLPPAVTPGAYRLVVQRQSGVGALPLTLAVGDIAQQLALVQGYLVWTPPQGAPPAAR